MTTQKVKRKLAGILSADVKGYSRLMGEDEVATMETLKSYSAAMSTLIQKHRGRVVDFTGDNVLADFVSVVDAVECAVEIQEEFKTRNAELPESRRMEFRIGVNVGDVIEDGDRIYGDGVNIAARVEGLAQGGGVCISGRAYDQVRNKLTLGFESLGEHTVKNIAEPVRVYRVLMEPEAAGKVFRQKKSGLRQWWWAAMGVVAVLVVGAGALAIWNFYVRPFSAPEGLPGNSNSRFSAGDGFAAKTSVEPTPITILIRMMEHQESWFIENIIKEFQQKNHCSVIIRRFSDDSELVEILKTEAETKKASNASLVKTPLHLTLTLYKEGLLNSYGDVLRNLEFSESEIESWLVRKKNEYEPAALKMCIFSTVTREELYYVPRKLETRMMIYRKSRIADAVDNWHKFKSEINALLREENGYGLPKNYSLEPDLDEWDYYDLMTVGYYWANTQYGGEKTPRIAHRSSKYMGTVTGLIDRALQLGGSSEDILHMNHSSDAIIDAFQWEAILRKYGLFCEGMWHEDGWFGLDIYKGMENNRVFLAWMHQLDSSLIYGSDQLGIKGYLNDKDDLGFSIMPQGVSFELTGDGLPKRTGTRKAHTFGWFWGIPKAAPELRLAYKLAMFITSDEPQLQESREFCIIPVTKRTIDALKAEQELGWKAEVFAKSFEQLKINGENFLPRFKTIADYKEFLDNYYNAFEETVIRRGYSPEGPEGRVDRRFIRKRLQQKRASTRTNETTEPIN